MISGSLSPLRGQKVLWLGLIVAEIGIGLTAMVIPAIYTLSLIIIVVLAGFFFAKPILGLLCVIPFLPNYLITFYSLGPADITPLELSLFVAILCWFVLCIRENRVLIRGSGTDAAIFLMIGWCLLAVFWSPSASRGMYQIVKMIPGLLIYYLHVQLVRSKRDFDLVLSAWIAMAAFFTVIGFFETVIYGVEAAAKLVGTGQIAHLTREVRANVFFKSPDDLGFILCISIVVAIAKFTTTTSKKWRRFLAVFLPLMLFVLLSTFSRKSILAVFVACGYLSWHNKKVFRSFVGISLMGVILLVLVASAGFLEALGSRLESYFMSPEVAISARVELWTLGFRLFGESPVFGNGLGSFFVIASALGSQFGSIHSFYLFVLCELGLVGFMFLLFWGFQIGQRFARFFRVNRDQAARLTGRAIVGGFIVLMITGLFRAMNLIDPIFWGFLGLSAAFLRTYMPQEGRR
jgi:O-antigen ligase